MKIIKPLVAAAVAGFAALPAVAVEVVLDFEGIWGEPTSTGVPPTAILDFYKDTARTDYLAAGGLVGAGATGPFGVNFSQAAAGIRNVAASTAPFGTLLAAQYSGNPSNGVLGFENRLITGTSLGNGFTFLVPNGFEGGISFDFSIIDNVQVDVLAQDGTTVLGSNNFEDNQLRDSEACKAAGVGTFCSWKAGSVSFAQATGYSVRFTSLQGGSGNFGNSISLFDNFRIEMNGELPGGATSPVPEPSTYALMALGLLGIGFATRRRMR